MENWKSISGYEGLYEVSDLGSVRSLKFGKTKILKPGNDERGYLFVNLYKYGLRNMVKVHRLVANAFLPNPQNLETVNHKDEDRTNNNVSNLEWMTQADNKLYSANKSVQMLDKLTDELLAAFPSIQDAARITGIAQSNIVKCCRGKLKSAGGYIWRYT